VVGRDIVVAFAPYARFVPKSALAGLLIVSAFGMIDWRGLLFHLRVTLFDAAIVAVTAISAVAVSVEFCILIGVLASFLLAVPRAGRMIRTEFIATEYGVRERADDEPVDEKLLIFGLEGELFFGSTFALDDHLEWIDARALEKRSVVILRVKRLRNPDAVGVADLVRFVRRMEAHGIHVILSGVRPDLHEALEVAGLVSELRPDQVFRARQPRGSSTLEAIDAARAFIREREKKHAD
jgi:SulP family sulfate permease